MSDTERVEAWLFGAAMPLWQSAGMTAQGLAVEEMDFSGAPKDTGHHRSMVQFRQVFCFAQAHLAGHADANLPRGLFARMSQTAWHRDGGWIHKLDSNGAPLDETRDTCDQAFALLAAAYAFKASGDEEILQRARQTLDFLDTHIADENGGFREAIPARSPRRQNAHMHLMEAFLALHEATGERRFLVRAEDMIALLTKRFADSAGFLHEHFGVDWTRHAGPDAAIEPGHHFEWVWLLHEYARLSGASLPPVTQTLFAAAMHHGCDGSGLAVARIDTDGQTRDATKMLWAQTEMLKALIARSEQAKENHAAAIARTLGAIFAQFLIAAPCGIWHEKLDAQGAPAATRMPASTFYHLTGAFTEFLRFRGCLPRLLAVRA